MNYNCDQILWDNFHLTREKMPYGGAVLTIKDGLVNDGHQWLARFNDTSEAEIVLAKAGFKSLGANQWK